MTEPPIEMDVQDVQAALSKDEIVLIDCREQDEYDTAKIEGAILLPMSQWLDVAERLEDIANRPLVVHCHHGGRSLRVTHWLRENGYADARNMTGGIDAWSQQVDSSVPRY